MTRPTPDLISIATIRERLGFALTSEFIAAVLKIEPAERKLRAILYTEAQFELMCRRLVAYVTVRWIQEP